MKNQSKIALGTWSWGAGFAGGDQVFGNNLGVDELRPVFDEAMANGVNLWDSAVVYGYLDQVHSADCRRVGRSGSRYAGREPRTFRHRLRRYLLDT